MLIRLVNKVIKKFGYVIKDITIPAPIDISSEKEFLALYEKCKPYTQTSIERLYSLYQSCLYVIDNDLKGDLVECGVWKGGSSMMMALTFLSRGISDRRIFMYDTYEGMSEPTEYDIAIHGELAENILSKEDKDSEDSIWCFASFEEVAINMLTVGYPIENIRMIKGKVEDTLPLEHPEKIAILRLDTDWYESTKVELEWLFPLLTMQCPLIIDDFGHWEGAKKAVIEYFGQQPFKPLLNRIDFTGRIMIKTST